MTNATHPGNRLRHERSPYLLQHAHNPVDWWPWSEEAFAKARREDKPVFLSIGYSACHWCHVMERESFEDAATAALLNEHFVSIKVDREERPDIDQIYQLAHQVLAQRGGGWPLSMFLSADKRPFFGGTYFPPAQRHGMPSFQDVLRHLVDAYQNRRRDVDSQAEELAAVLQRVAAAAATPHGALEPGVLTDAVAAAMKRAAPRYGGFGRAPKFPNTMSVDLLFIAAATRADATARAHAATTLDHMARGGIYDHLGGGFARYSTDEQWLIPHFEKMLYDNAQLARLYLDGARLFADNEAITPARCRAVVADVLQYIAREMTDESGAFYSAQDADSEGVEGKYFVWTPATLAAVLGPDAAVVVGAYYGVTPEGNFEHGNSALWTPRTAAEVGAAVGRSADEVLATVAAARPKLFAAREQRIKPLRDDKCLAAWNALLIGALADAGATLAEPAWTAAARKALGAWRERAWADGHLMHAMKAGVPYGVGFLDDYAGLAGAALDVYEGSFDPADLAFARALGDALLALFWDDTTSEFYYTPADGEVVLMRSKDPHDHAYPGGVGLAADALLRLGTLTGETRYRDVAERLLANFAVAARENPLGLATVTRAVDRATRGAVEIVIAGDPATPAAQALLRAARSVYVPHRTLACAPDEATAQRHGLDPALLAGRRATDTGAPVAYVCRGTVCDTPVSTPAALVETLRRAVAG